MTTRLRRLSTRAAFISWLLDHSSDTFARRHIDDCPLARYTRGWVTSDEYGPESGGIGASGTRYKLPAWASAFIHQWDWKYKSGGHDCTGRVALYIMRHLVKLEEQAARKVA